MKKFKLFLYLLFFLAIMPSLSYAGYVKGTIDPGNPFYSPRIGGWACVTGLPESIDVHVYARDKNNHYYFLGFGQKIANSNAVYAQCQVSNTTAKLRFVYTLTLTQQARFSGMRLYAFGIGTAGAPTRPLSHSGQRKVPSISAVIDFTHVGFQWNNDDTLGCQQLKGTVLSFPGASGNTHLPGSIVTGPDENRVAHVVGSSSPNNNCVRYIQIFVKENYLDSRRKGHGFIAGANFVNKVIAYAKSHGLAQGSKTIFVGSSFGAHFGATALDWTGATYLNAINRSIFASGPFVSSLFSACTRAELGSAIRGGYNLLTGATNANPCADNPSYDLVNTSNHGQRAYLNGNAHKIAILIGGLDTIGCPPNIICPWNPVAENRLYIEGIGFWSDFTHDNVEATSAHPRVRSVITTATHDLWINGDFRELVCRNILDEVGVDKSACTPLRN